MLVGVLLCILVILGSLTPDYLVELDAHCVDGDEADAHGSHPQVDQT